MRPALTLRKFYFYRRVCYCTLSLCMRMLCAYSTFGHHPHPLGYLCANFHFIRGPHCWASLWKKLHTQSINQSMNKSLTHPAYLMPWETKLPKIPFPISNTSFYSTIKFYLMESDRFPKLLLRSYTQKRWPKKTKKEMDIQYLGWLYGHEYIYVTITWPCLGQAKLEKHFS